MTKEEEAINSLEKLINIRKNKAGQIKYDNCICSTTDLETVLNMLKENSAEIHQKNTELAEKNAEIEKYKKLLVDNLAKELNNSIKAKEKANTDLKFLDLGWKTELEKKDKMIDLMLDDLNVNGYPKEELYNSYKNRVDSIFEREVEDERN